MSRTTDNLAFAERRARRRLSIRADGWLLAFFGLRYPLQMLPLLLFEFAWKLLWTIAYGLPQWSAGQFPPTFAEDAFKDGHRVGVLLSYEATNPQLGRRVSVRELQLYRVVDGKIAERWYAADRRAARGES